MLFAKIIRELRKDHAESDKKFVQVIVALLTLIIVFSMLHIISTTIDYMHKLCFLYMQNYPVIYSLSEIEREAVNMQ